MKCYYYDATPNVGDELNRHLWLKVLSPDLFSDDSRVGFLGVGTLLGEDFCKRLSDCERIVVFGTGAGYGRLPVIDSRWDIRCVRGKQTAHAIGADERLAIADAAYLLGTLDWHSTSNDSIVVIPHHASLAYIDWDTVCQQAGLTFLSPALPVEEFLGKLAGARLVLTEAMHGAIFSDIARIPWVPFRFGPHFLESKWHDWSQMFDLSPTMLKADAFYDPASCYVEEGGAFHAKRRVKSFLARAGMGKKRWLKLMPPGHVRGEAGKRLARFLQQLTKERAYLSGEQIFKERVAKLYEELAALSKQYGVASRELSGPLIRIFD